jgi:hypothetical protein
MNGRTGSTDDAAVVLEMAAGSEAALETLYDRYATSIFAAAILDSMPPLLTPDTGPSAMRSISGVIDDYAIWSRALSGDEVAAIDARAVPDSL